MEKQCSNGHINPSEAKFCRTCGEPFTESVASYTPDCFPTIHLIPASIKKIRFLKGGEIFSLFFSMIIIVGGLIGIGVFDFDFDDVENVLHDDLIGVVIFLSIIAVLLLFGITRGLKHLIDYCVFRHYAVYIEETKDEMARIAKDGKLGLFNQIKNKLLLTPRYKKIEKFDSKHYLIGKDRFLGLYSISRNKVIIPVICDMISPEKDGIIEVSIKGSIQHFDILGNRLH